MTTLTFESTIRRHTSGHGETDLYIHIPRELENLAKDGDKVTVTVIVKKSIGELKK